MACLLNVVVFAAFFAKLNARKSMQSDIDELCDWQEDVMSTDQLDFCKGFPRAYFQLSRGGKEALSECRSQFRHELWNCSSPHVVVHSHLQFWSSEGGPEEAFLQALKSAAMIRRVALLCQNQAAHCPGSGSHESKLSVATAAVVGFLDADPGPRLSSTMHRHNVRLGAALLKSLVDNKKQRCHGFDCDTEHLPSLRRVADILKAKLSSALLLSDWNEPSELVFERLWADWCAAVPSRGRPCVIRSAAEASSCGRVCCGRGFVAPPKSEFRCHEPLHDAPKEVRIACRIQCARMQIHGLKVSIVYEEDCAVQFAPHYCL